MNHLYKTGGLQNPLGNPLTAFDGYTIERKSLTNRRRSVYTNRRSAQKDTHFKLVVACVFKSTKNRHNQHDLLKAYRSVHQEAPIEKDHVNIDSHTSIRGDSSLALCKKHVCTSGRTDNC